MLVNGAAAMDGFTTDGLPVEPPPSCRQGFGRLHLARSLRLEEQRGPSLYVSDGLLGAMSHGDVDTYCISMDAAVLTGASGVRTPTSPQPHPNGVTVRMGCPKVQRALKLVVAE